MTAAEETYTALKAKAESPIKDAVVNVKASHTVDYRSNVTVTATVSGIPEGCVLAIYDADTLVAAGDNTKVSYKAGEMRSSKTFTVKVIDASTKQAQKDGSGNELSKDCKVEVNSGFFQRLIAFFKGLFNALPSVEIHP